MRVAKSCVGALLPAFLVAGCILGPNYKKPEITVPDSFRAQITASDATSFADLPWWSVFGDTALQGLVTEALANNNDLQIAVARIEQARAMVGVSESQGKPQIGYQASAAGEKGLVLQQNGSAGPLTYGAFQGLLNATWELDIWGRIRRSTEAARANLLAQQDVRRGVILTLVSDLAADYFRLLELDRELAIAEESARVYKDTLGLFTTRFDAGRDSKLPVDRTQANYDSSNANIQDLRRGITQQENAISTLVGAYPKAIQRGHPLTEQSTPETPLGTTTAVLQRRPDILQAEQNIISANAEIGVAVADRFPRVGLSAFLGGQGIVTDSWAGFGVWNAALSAAGPIYTGGRLEEVYHQRQAYWDETVAQYKQKVLVAFQETSDALVARQTLILRRTALESQVRALRSSSDLALMRYQAGRAAYFEVLEAQQQLFPAESALAQTQRDQLVAVVNLYKALGGGWNADEAKPTEPAANAPPMQGPAERGERQ
jgi:multidrug efflux system outer membrane protein